MTFRCSYGVFSPLQFLSKLRQDHARCWVTPVFPHTFVKFSFSFCQRFFSPQKWLISPVLFTKKESVPHILSRKIQKSRSHEKSCSSTNLFGLSVGLAEQSCSTVMCFLQLHDVLISQALSHMASRAVGGRWWSDPEQTKWVPALLLRPSQWAS